jgi:regulator of sigma E protease
MSFLWKLAAFVVLVGALVFFHELGHFLAAKFFRVKVLRFSVGFGPRVAGFRRGETEYQVAALPLGGYVRMAGEDPTQPVAAEDKGRTFSEQPPHRRAVIALAGPLVNLLLPPLVFFAINLMPQPEMPAVVGVVLPGEPADVAGVQSGDRVLSIEGVPTLAFEQMRSEIEARAGVPTRIVLERDGARLELTVTPSSELEETPVETVRKGKVGIVAGKLPSYVGVQPGSRAWQAGLRTFDRVVSVDGRPAGTAVELDRILRARPNEALAMRVTRAPALPAKGLPPDGEPLELAIPAGEDALGIERADLYVQVVTPDSAAARAGLRPLDKIVALDGVATSSGPRFERAAREALRQHRPLRLTVERDGQPVAVEYQPPLVKRNDPYLGEVEEHDYGFSPHARLFVSEPFRDDELVQVSYPPLQALQRGVATTGVVLRDMLLGLQGLFAGRISTKTIGGPIMLFQLAGAASERGLATFLRMFALISINLGLVNLLPIPVLDGFHIVVAGVEGISRRALPARFREVATYVGLAMVLALMLLAVYNDVVRTLSHASP